MLLSPSVIYLLILLGMPLYGQQISAFTINENKSDYGNILENIYFLQEAGHSLTLDSVLDKPDGFSRYRGEVLQNKHIYWFTFRLHNNTNEDLELFLDLGDFDFFEAYVVTGKIEHKVVKGGMLRPAWELTYPEGRRYILPMDIEKEKSIQCIIRVSNSEYISPHAVFKLFGEEVYQKHKGATSSHLLQGAFHGLLWVMILYNIFFAFIGRDKTYWYYALYMITISLYFLNISGYLTKYVYPNHPEFGKYIWLLSQTATLFYIIFIRKFLDLKNIHPRWYKFSRHLIHAVIAFVVFKAGYFLIYKEYGILSYLSQFVLVMGVVFTCGLIYSLYRTRNKLAQYFTIGSIALGVGLLSATIVAMRGDPFSRAYFNSIQIGIVFEIIFFSIGLSYKMRESERQKRQAQEELVDQMKKNEKLQLEYQHELEQKVIKRTEQIERQKEVLEEQKYRLEEVNDEKNHLIGIVAHDLRNPLTSALSMAQLLEGEEEDEEKAEMGQVIMNSLKRMNEMIGKILDIKAIESQVIKLDKVIFDMADAAEEIVQQFETRAKQKSIKIHKDLKPASVSLDKDYFRQIIENLISNAIKFSPNHKNIFISTYQENGRSVLKVSDEGPGFTEEDLKKVFGKYQKLSARPTGNESSTGIGLSIVKKYVETMDGTIELNSEAGNGAAFRIEFVHV